MTCCKCVEYEWADPQEVVYTDPKTGEGYCLFHAPADKKGMSVKEFNGKVLERIQTTLNLGDENAVCMLDGTVFPENFYTAERCKLPGISLKNACFKGSAGFSGVRFKGPANFGGAYFKEDASFECAQFGERAEFDCTKFVKCAHFNGSCFKGIACFDSALFIGEANFSEALFDGSTCFKSKFLKYAKFNKSFFKNDVTFCSAFFEDAANFIEAKFQSKVDFSLASFAKSCVCTFKKAEFSSKVKFLNANFDHIEKSSGFLMFCTDFSYAKFNDDVIFDSAKFKAGVDFTSSEFNHSAKFYNTKLHKETIFSKSLFHGLPCFHGTKFLCRTNFTDVVFDEQVEFIPSESCLGTEDCNIDEECRNEFSKTVKFESVKFLRGAIFFDFLHNGHSSIIFSNCIIPTCGIIFMNCDPTCLDLTQQYDITDIHFINSPWEKNGRIKACTEDQDEMLQPTRDFYQRMKAKYKVENNEYEASKWHIAEKEAQLKLLRQNGESRFLWTMLWLYKAVSRFGEDPLRAGSVLGGFVLLVWLLLGMEGIASSDLVIQGVGFSWEGVSNLGTVFMTMFKNVMLFKPESIAFKPLHDGINGLVLVLTRLVIPLLAALFAFALRNRFRR